MRTCDGCGARMSPHIPRLRVGDDLLCKGCADKNPNSDFTQSRAKKGDRMNRPKAKIASDYPAAVEVDSDGRVIEHDSLTPDLVALIQSHEWHAPLGFFDDCPICVQAREGHSVSRKVAHDSGDGETLYHCPFCGAGQLVARSDGTAECQFCGTAFTVQVQPKHPSMPQTIDGEPKQMPDMPGGPGEPGEAVEQDEPDETEMELEPDEEQDELGRQENPFTSKRAGLLDYYDVKVHRRGDEFAYFTEFESADAAEAIRVAEGYFAEPDVTEVIVQNRGSGDVFWRNGEHNFDARFAKKRYFLTSEGAALPEESFIKHLALRFADDRPSVLAAIRKGREAS